MGRLHRKCPLHDPVGKAKSVWLTEKGLERTEALFYALFAKADAPG